MLMNVPWWTPIPESSCIILTKYNVREVAKKACRAEEGLAVLIEMYEKMGVYPVRVPIAPVVWSKEDEWL